MWTIENSNTFYLVDCGYAMHDDQLGKHFSVQFYGHLHGTEIRTGNKLFKIPLKLKNNSW